MSISAFDMLNSVIVEINSYPFERCLDIVTQLCSIILGESKWSDAICSEEFAECIWMIFLEGARGKWSVEHMREKLSLHADSSLCKALIEVYKKNVEMLRSQLYTIRWDHQELIDVEWNIGKAVESNIIDRIARPTASFILHTLPAGKTKSNRIEFYCDWNQLQDLNWKIKEALHCLSQLKTK